MKRFAVFVFALALSGSIGAQTTAPKTVVQAFQKKFPAASAVQWEEEDDGDHD